MQIEYVDINKLKPNPRNRNQHSAEQIDRLAQIIKYQGWRFPIVADKDNVIWAGHGRVLAAKKLKEKLVPVSYQEFTTQEQAYAFLISDNAIASWADLDISGVNSDLGDLGPDFDIDLLGIKGFEIDVADKDPGCDEDEVPESVPAKTQKGDIYQLGRHRLMCGDSTMIDDVEKLMAGEKAELCFTSPPYSDQREYNGEKELSTEHLATFIRSAFGVAKYFAVNLGYSRKDGEVNPYWDDYIKEARGCGLKLLSWNVWDKGHCGSIGNQNAMFGICHEWVFVFGTAAKDLNRTVENSHFGEKTDHTGNRQADGTIKKSKAGTIKKSKAGTVGQFSQLKTVLTAPPQMARDDIDHPARFPVHFPEAYINAMTDVGDCIYEPFGGSGTTLIAADKCGRACNSMELDPIYCDVIVARWEKYTGQKAELLNGQA